MATLPAPGEELAAVRSPEALLAGLSPPLVGNKLVELSQLEAPALQPDCFSFGIV